MRPRPRTRAVVASSAPPWLLECARVSVASFSARGPSPHTRRCSAHVFHIPWRAARCTGGWHAPCSIRAARCTLRTFGGRATQGSVHARLDARGSTHAARGTRGTRGARHARFDVRAVRCTRGSPRAGSIARRCVSFHAQHSSSCAMREQRSSEQIGELFRARCARERGLRRESRDHCVHSACLVRA